MALGNFLLKYLEFVTRPSSLADQSTIVNADAFSQINLTGFYRLRIF